MEISSHFLKQLRICTFILGGVCAVGMTVLIGNVIWNATHLLYPTPETQSAFLQHYTPKQVFSSFACHESAVFSQHSGAAAGRKYVTRNAGFEWIFVISPEKWAPLMDALRQDAYDQLVSNGAQILSQSGDSRTGFHFDYKTEHVLGSLTIFPLAASNRVQRATPLPRGLGDVSSRIEQTEKWFPNAQGMIQASLANTLH